MEEKVNTLGIIHKLEEMYKRISYFGYLETFIVMLLTGKLPCLVWVY